MIAVQLIIAGICGMVAALIASHKGRSSVGWFFAGFFLGIIGVVVVACLPNLKEQRAYRERTESEQRRLREQLRQERAKLEAYRQHSTGRLDAHDEALGIDTRSVGALPADDQATALRFLADGKDAPAAAAGANESVRPAESAQAGPERAASPAPPGPDLAGALWYYEARGQAIGPVSENDIRNLLRAGKLGVTTLLWTEDLGHWTPADKIATFRSAVNP